MKRTKRTGFHLSTCSILQAAQWTSCCEMFLPFARFHHSWENNITVEIWKIHLEEHSTVALQCKRDCVCVCEQVLFVQVAKNTAKMSFSMVSESVYTRTVHVSNLKNSRVDLPAIEPCWVTPCWIATCRSGSQIHRPTTPAAGSPVRTHCNAEQEHLSVLAHTQDPASHRSATIGNWKHPLLQF